MKLAVALLLVVVLAALASPAHAQSEPIELTEADPPDGARLDTPPEMINLCFSQPVSIEDDTFFFFYRMPDGLGVGIRTAFVRKGECAGITANLPDDPLAGEYTLQWRVRAAEGGEEGSGTIRFQVSAGGMSAPSPSPTSAPAAATDDEPALDSTASAQEADDDDGPDIPLTAAITVGVAAAAAVLFTLGYLLRRRIGFDPHRPPESEEEGDGER